MFTVSALKFRINFVLRYPASITYLCHKYLIITFSKYYICSISADIYWILEFSYSPLLASAPEIQYRSGPKIYNNNSVYHLEQQPVIWSQRLCRCNGGKKLLFLDAVLTCTSAAKLLQRVLSQPCKSCFNPKNPSVCPPCSFLLH